ncbi:predicted protein [Micromonas commoda]|uniref:Uncharacterized protein n=1 Tax=Micromonas commoda (strain RCC299 / NOUM17 / CCMP2709) TaxID=296587 RepID=C1EE80_MICCC|nr:predicted protein [Micromonas commoda]ACO66186.1 predicted protein [Micromonas commoda]|eukprot:XP_002504928.1 predicted protein [Micromonas commoda]
MTRGKSPRTHSMYGSAQVAGSRRERAQTSRSDPARDMARVTEAAMAQSPHQAVQNLIRATPAKSAKKKRQSVAFATAVDGASGTDDPFSTSPKAIASTSAAADIIAAQARRFAAERAAGLVEEPGDAISSAMWSSAKGATEAVAAAVANTSRENAAHLVSRAASAHAEHAADVAAAAAAHASAAAAAARDDPSPETEAEAQTAAAIAREAAEMATRAAAKATSAATRASADDVNRRIAAARDAMRGADGFDVAAETERLRRSQLAATQLAARDEGLLPPTPPPRTRHTIMSEVYQSAASGLGGGAGGGGGGAQLSRATEPSSPSVGRLPATPAHAYTRSPSRVDAVAVARERRVGSAAVKVKTPGKLGISGAAARVPARAMTREAAGAYDLAEARRKLSKLSKEAPSPAMRFKARPAPSYTKPRRPDSASAARVASLRENAPAVKKRDPLSFDSMADSALDRRHSRFEANMVERERRIMNQMIHYNDDKSEAGTPKKDVKMHPWVGKSPEKKASESPGAHAVGLLGVHMPRPTKKSIAIAEAARQRRIDREVAEAMAATEKQYGSPVERRGNPYLARSPGVALTKTAASAPGSARRLMADTSDARIRLEKSYAEGRLNAARALLAELETERKGTSAPDVADDDVWALDARSRGAVAALRGRL